MKRVVSFIILMLLAIAIEAPAAGKLMSLNVKKGSLRTSPSFLGAVTSSLDYGNKVTVIETKGDWSKVSPVTGGAAGWIHNSALTKKEVKLTSSDKNSGVAASSGELALAGKGFNSDVEAEFKSKNKEIDFTWIDKMEKFNVPHNDMQAFLSAGAVKPKGGAR